MASQAVFEVLRLLAPRDVPGVGKVRIGGDGDGGYVLLDRLDPAQVVMSFGVGPTVTFERDLAERGHRVVMFDHTVDALPDAHPAFIWHRLGLAARDDAPCSLYALPTLMRRLPPSDHPPILKMDVEGAEWPALAVLDPDVLGGFAQITLELHGLLSLEQPPFNAQALAALRVLRRDFVPVHVHANNYGRLDYVGGFACADTIEVTFARSGLYPDAPSATIYPTALDTPNFAERPDYLLWFFPYLPGGEAAVLPA